MVRRSVGGVRRRLDRFAAVEIFEADEGDVRDMGEASVNAALKKEAEQILPRLQRLYRRAGYRRTADVEHGNRFSYPSGKR